ncbi:TIGR01777 family oxidoreductase [Kribbella sp. NPDC003557]|uniref:TIGR01777 family oxidoreductase n=1 Tax=Kribbella sp. NPDC003557 TaxID=3154449 RepID=UPI0033B05241
MGLTRSAVVAAPRPEVFAWHERPGAIVRLTPPWMPVSIEQEATDLAGGTAVLGFPLGFRWIARHSSAEAPERFVDEFDTPLARQVVQWRHTHEFVAEDDDHTRVVDDIRSNVPGFLLRSMLDYRHRQLADDLAAQQRARAAGMRPLTIAVTGTHGTIGRSLCALLSTAGHTVVKLVRGEPRDTGERRWDPASPDRALLEGIDAVVHLAGASIAGRFTPQHKQQLRDSRIGPTTVLAELAATTDTGPSVFVSASAIGYYGADRGDEELAEDSAPGEGFLAELVSDWEQATEPAAAGGLRVVQVRTGLVQTPAGGTLKALYPLFAAGLGGRLGSGKQWQAWIGIDDLLDIYHRALYDEQLSGPVNAVAPEPVRNQEYADTLARVLHRPALVPTPSFGPRLVLGAEGAKELAEANQRVVPTRLAGAGHVFRYSELEPALRHLLGRPQG